MTQRLRTLEGDEIETGFWGPDTSKVQMGNLPPMTTQQFVGYAALALAHDIIPALDSDTRNDWARQTRALHENVESLPVKKYTGKFFAQDADELSSRIESVDIVDRDELWSEIAAAVVPVERAEYYDENPFIVQPDGQRVEWVHADTKHTVDSDSFFSLAYIIIRGGLMGWDRSGTFQEIKDAARLMNDALTTDEQTAA